MGQFKGRFTLILPPILLDNLQQFFTKLPTKSTIIQQNIPHYRLHSLRSLRLLCSIFRRIIFSTGALLEVRAGAIQLLRAGSIELLLLLQWTHYRCYTCSIQQLNEHLYTSGPTAHQVLHTAAALWAALCAPTIQLLLVLNRAAQQ